MRKLSILIGAAIAAAPLGAQQTPAGAAWRALAGADAAAALRLIEENHPGAAPELGDAAFQARLAAAKAHVAERLPKVADFGGYSALMNGLATDFRDGHIWSNPAGIGLTARRWAGLVIVRRGGAWIVGAQERAEGEPDLTNARLLACDGQEADALARIRLGQFGANPDVEAQLARRAPALLLDDGNPFLEPPEACRFDVAGKQQALKLGWRRIAQARLEQVAGDAIRPARAGMGVMPFARGYWIALETLNPSAETVVTQAAALRDALRAAPMVVLDMRGNGGGNSQFGERIAQIVAGDALTAAAGSRMSDCSGAYWRASPGNLETLRALAARAGAESGWMALSDDMAKAIAERRAFTPALPPCAARTAATDQGKRIARQPRSAMRGRLVLVTDRACFSSCLIVANLFRRMGALHVGEATDVSTRYMEVRENTLPSGLRTFSTLQKVAVGLGDFGPYVPDRVYPGALDDTDALKAWVAGLP